MIGALGYGYLDDQRDNVWSVVDNAQGPQTFHHLNPGRVSPQEQLGRNDRQNSSVN